MKNKTKYILLFISLIVFLTLFIINYKKNTDIDIILKKSAYSYLPKEAKNYIKEIYEKTGKVILTEKNKKENTPYLNPQYVEYLVLENEEKKQFGAIPTSMIVDYSNSDTIVSQSIPSNYDLRNADGKNYVTPIRNQGSLGICWTFATAGAVESFLLKKSNSTYTSSSTLISERQIDYATSRNGIKDYTSEYVSFINRSLGDGGNIYISTIAMANGISLINYNDFKEYNDHDLGKMELAEILSYNNSQYEVDSTINFPRLNIRESTSILTDEEQETRNNYLNEVKQNIMENGAAYVSTYMDSSCQYTDSNLNNTIIDVYNCNAIGGHAMEIIGWNDDLEYSYCADTKNHKSNLTNCNNIVSGKGVWILKNSWGNNTQNPYLTYDSLYTSISFITELTESEDRIWDNNYIIGDGTEYLIQKTYSFSDTKIKGNEKIKRIKLITDTANSVLNVKIYKKDGTYETFSKTAALPGLITIDIDKDITVDKDSTIIITSDGGYIDRIMLFTANCDNNPYINLNKYNNLTISENNIRLYSETKNISSGQNVTYKLYNSNNEDFSNRISVTNNTIAENNINTSIKFLNNLTSGSYRIDAIYNSNVLASVNINFVKMQGLGTKDSPYIITNITHLYQIRDDLTAYYELGNDIDLTEDTREGGKYSLESNTCPQGFGWEAINGFSGSLDGKGHTIKGLYQNNYLTCNEEKQAWYEWNNNGNGLFGTMKGNATIKNLVLEDFDINCQGGYCAALVSKYIGNMNDLGYSNNSDQTEYTATFENIAIKNSKMRGVYNSYNSNSSLRNSYGGGLLGYLESNYGNINISNIYLDIDLTPKDISDDGYLAMGIRGNEVNIQNIRLLGDLQGKASDGSGDAILIHNIYGNTPISIKNVISTVTATNVMGSILGHVWNSNLVLDGINILNIEDKPLCNNNDCSNATNVNIYNKKTQLVEFTKLSNYDSWIEFDDNWDIKTIDGIPRIPALKFMDFDYTSIPNITINQTLNEKESFYDYVSPDIPAAKRINYQSNDESIVTIDEEGIIIPQATGSTTIHVESLYDGYIKDVPINVTYIPHYNVTFAANGGEGTMETIEVEAGQEYSLPSNTFTKEHYVFKEWNTKADGTGDSYSDMSQIPAMNDKESLTLYAQWIGEEIIITFDAAGGNVTPNRKTVHYGGTYGELPIPTKTGYAFEYWYASTIIVDAITKINGTNLTASWEEDAYTILYDANNGSLKSDYSPTGNLKLMSTEKAITIGNNNVSKNLSQNIYERPGYRFVSWNTKSDGSGISYNENQTITLNNVNNNLLTLYAIWEKTTGIITYNSNWANNETKTQNITYDTATQLEKNTFTREKYTFKDWNTKADGTGTSYLDEQTITTNENLTLYAQWLKNEYTITFYANDGTNTIITQKMYEDELTALNKNSFILEGYTFKKWNTKNDGTGTSYNDEQTIAINDNLTLYAIWEKETTFTINKYEVNENYITKITITTTIDNFKKNIKLGSNYTISVDTKYINNKNILYTGGKTKIYKNQNLYKEYINVVIGDINGDGEINSADLLKIRQHLLIINSLTNAYFKSADINYDKQINSADLLRIRQHLLNVKSIS